MSAARLLWIVLGRDLGRWSRRWPTWALRAAVSAALLAVALWLLAELQTRRIDPGSAALVGRRLFLTWAWVQMAAGAMLAPLLTAAAVREELETGTADLVALTPVTLVGLLAARVVGSVGLVALTLLGTLPMVGVCIHLGGVGPWEVVGAEVGTLLVAAVAGGVGGVAATRGVGPVGAMLVALAYTGVVLGVVPTLAGISRITGPSIGPALSPVAGAGAGGPSGLFPILATLGVLVAIAQRARVLFDLALHDPRDPGPLHAGSAGAALQEQDRQAGVVAFVTAALLPGVLISVCAPRPLFVGVVWCWTALAMFATAQLGLQAMTGLLGLVTREVAGPAVVTAGATTTLWTGWRAGVWGAPVAWREVMTRWHGVLGGASRGALLFMAGLFALALVVGAPGPAALLRSGLVLLAMAVAASAMVATGSMTAERVGGTLPVFLVIPGGARHLVGGKLLANGIQTLPVWGVAAAMVLAGPGWPDPDAAGLGGAVACTPARALFAGGGRALGTGAWAVAAWAGVAALSLWVAWRAMPRSLAWSAVSGGWAALFVGPWVLASLWPAPVTRGIAALVVPFADPAWSDAPCTIPAMLPLSAALWSAGAVAGTFGLARRLAHGALWR